MVSPGIALALDSYMKCCNTECKANATTLMRYKTVKHGVANFVFCDAHATAKVSKLTDKLINFKVGPKCPFCECGYIDRLRHIDRGMCYRCNGTGYTGKPNVTKFEVTK